MNPNTPSRRAPFTLWRAALGAVLAAAVLAGCSSSGRRLEPPAPVENRMPVAAADSGTTGGSGVGSGQVSESRVAGVDTTPSGDALPSAAGRVVYFDYDSYVVKDEYRGVIDTNARYLAADAKRRMQVEGHTDERGGREYNLALGQRRAEAVVRAMTLLGARPDQLEAVSYGKERPAAQGSDEAAWAKNRRAELKERG